MSLSSIFTRAASADVWYSSRVYVNGGTSPYTFQITDGSLPAGMYIRKDGSSFYLEGRPSKADKYTFTFRVRDMRNSYTEKKNTVTVTGTHSEPEEADDMSIIGSVTTNRRVNRSYSSSVHVEGYSSSVTWSLASGTLPPGLSLIPSGSYLYIEGIPNTGGTYKFTIRAVDSRNLYAERSFTIKINDYYTKADDMAINGDFITGRRTNEYTSSYVYTSGHVEDVEWTLAGGELPPGLYLAPSGSYIYLRGLPNTGGTYTFTLRAADNRNYYVERQFTVKVIADYHKADDMAINEKFISGRRINESYSSYVYVGGYLDNVSWTLVSGGIPSGMYFRPSNNYMYLEGIPNKGGTYTFTLRATDNRNAYVERTFTVNFTETPYKAADMSINENFDTNKPVNEEYYDYVYVDGYVDNVNWTLVSGDIPSGLYLSPSGRYIYLRGIPNKSGTYSFTLRATDNRNAYVDRNFTVAVNGTQTKTYTAADDMSITGTFAEGFTVKNWYSSSVYIAGGTSEYIYNITSGSLPPGFFIRRDGSTFYLEGIPNKAGTYTFTLRVMDARDTYAEREFTVKINGGHYAADDMSINGVLDEGYTVNNWYSSHVYISGGVSNFSYNIMKGSLPPGFYFRADWSNIYFEGIPDKAGEYTFTLRVTDRRNAYAERELTLVINGDEEETPEAITIKTNSLAYAGTGQNYSQTLKAEGTVTSWKVTSGKLPAGLELSEAGGVISGTVQDSAIEHNASSAKKYEFEVTAANTSGGSAAKTFTIEVYEPLTIITETLPDAYVGEAYSVEIETTGTEAAVWVLRPAADVPSWLKYHQDERSCSLSGTPTAAGTYTFTAEGGNIYCSSSKKYTLTIQEKPSDGIPDLTWNGSKYRLIERTATFAEAEAECKAMGGHLAVIHSEEENQAIVDYILRYAVYREFMIGLQDPAGASGTWDTWVTGEPVTYTNWGPGQPDFSGQTVCILCADSNSYYGWSVGEWDSGYDGHYGFICEWDDTSKPEFKTHSLLLSGQIGVNFYMNLPGISGVDYADTYMDFDIAGDKSNPEQMYDPEFMNKKRTYYGFRCYIKSIQMADPITAVLHYGDGKTLTHEYSAKKYLDDSLAANIPDVERSLIEAIKDFGHYAQLYLSRVNGWELGTAHEAIDCENEYSDSDIEAARQAVDSNAIVKDIPEDSGIKRVGFSLNLDADTTINLYIYPEDGYTGSIAAYIPGSTTNDAVYYSDRNRYKVEINNIPAHRLAETFTVRVAGKKEFDVKVSAFSYVYAALNDANAQDDEINTVVSLYRYYTTNMDYRAANGL